MKCAVAPNDIGFGAVTVLTAEAPSTKLIINPPLY
jgi:hypothetical protein